MALRSISTHRLVRPVAALTLAAAGILGFAGVAQADSSPTSIKVETCVDGTTNRNVSVTLTTNATFVTAFRLYVVSGSATGTASAPIERAFKGPGSTTFNLELPDGVYWFDWEDADGAGKWSGRHSVIPDPFYNALYLGTRTPVAACVVETTTTTTAPATTTTTIATTTTAPATTTTVAVGVPTTQTAATTSTTSTTTSTSTTIAVNVPTTAVVQTTAAASANTLPATGANSTPLIAAGVAFLGLGSVAVLSTRRRRPATQL